MENNKPIGQVVGDLIAVLVIKDVITLEDCKTILGEDNFKKIIEEA